MRVLYGRNHTTLGEVAVVADGRAAAALSPGRFPKGYPHTDPNEDCVAVADLGTRVLLAAADGHHGVEASHAAIGAVAQVVASLQHTTPRRLVEVVIDAVAEITSGSRTALTVALFDAQRGQAFTFGDTYLIRLRDSKGKRLNRPAPFLDAGSTAEDARFDRFSLRPGDRILAATDGLIDFLGRSALARLAAIDEPDPTTWVNEAIDLALTGGAGDNIGVALGGLQP
ncbi:MAG: PP2C family protein-serine/threonine phosphatase [Acidimicrobiia bacterium]